MNRSLRRCAAVAGAVMLVSSCGDPDTVADGAPAPVATTSEPSTSEPSTTSPTAPPTIEPVVDPTPPASTATSTPESNEGGLGDPIWTDGDFTMNSPRALSATVRQDDNGCWLAEMGTELVPLALPPGFEAPDGESQRLVGPDGFDIVDGTAIDGTGQIVWLTDVAGGADGRWGNLMAFCAPAIGGVAAFATVTPAFDPNRLDDDELVAMLESASLTESWGCGFGFAVSTADQRVGLFMYTDAASTSDEMVVLPDTRWDATVMVGKDLFANHCDDVVEFHEPETIVAATWPLTAGSFEVAASASEGEWCGTIVTTRLTGAVVGTPRGDIPLGDLDLVNDAWGCFAG